MHRSEFETVMKGFDERFRETADDAEDFDQQLVDVPEMSDLQYREFLRSRSSTDFGRLFAELRDFVVPRCLDWYAGTNDEERDAVLGFLAEHGFVRIALWALMNEYHWRLQKAPPDRRAATLTMLLMVAILTGEFIERMETSHILTSAWGDAEDGGLDPARFFREAARLAGRRKLSHGQSAREILSSFEPYDYGTAAKS